MYFGGFLLGFLTIGILKTLVTLLALWLMVEVARGLRGAPGARFPLLARPEYALPGWCLLAGLFSFLISELTCGIEIYVLMRATGPLRLVHGYSSALGAGLLVYGVFTSLDRRALHYFDESRPCVLVPVCRGCPRREGEACGFHWAYVLGLCLVILMAAPLLFLPVQDLLADPASIALPYESANAWFDQKLVPLLETGGWRHESLRFTIPREMTLAEYRHVPIASAVLALAALGLSWVRRGERLSFFLACLAAGALAYSYLDAAVYGMVPHVYLGSLGHETAEFLGLALMGTTLRQSLGDGQ